MNAHEAASSSGVTFINVFEIPADHVDGFIEQWRERARIMSQAPGFRDTRLHKALIGETRFQLVNVAHWDSQEAWEAATSTPEFQASLRVLNADQRIQVSANPALYEVAVEFDTARPQ